MTADEAGELRRIVLREKVVPALDPRKLAQAYVAIRAAHEKQTQLERACEVGTADPHRPS